MTLAGGCHCGAVRFTVEAQPPLALLDCNCSICSKSGYLHLIVPEADFELRQGEESLMSYRFGTRTAEHLFCETCGVKSFYRPRSHPDGISVNFRCLDESATLEASVTAFDGREWERSCPGIA